MAFAVRNLCFVGYNNGFTLWHYRTINENIADIVAENYFLDANDMLVAGDVIIIHARDGVAQRYVVHADSELVSIAPLL